MNKFQQLISGNGDEVLVRRAGNIATTASIAQQTLVNNLTVQKAELENKIMNLTDLAPDSKDSLRPGSANWNPSQWVENLQKAKEELYNVEIRLKLATDTFKEYFTEIEK